MKIWSDLSEKLGIEKNVFCQRSFSLCGNDTFVVEGAKKIVSIKSDQICFLYGNSFLTVYGQNLVIKSLEKGFAVIVGKIEKIDF